MLHYVVVERVESETLLNSSCVIISFLAFSVDFSDSALHTLCVCVFRSPRRGVATLSRSLNLAVLAGPSAQSRSLPRQREKPKKSLFAETSYLFQLNFFPAVISERRIKWISLEGGREREKKKKHPS